MNIKAFRAVLIALTLIVVVDAEPGRKLLQGGSAVPKVIAAAPKGTPSGGEGTGAAAQAAQGATAAHIDKAASGEKQTPKPGPNAATVPKVIANAPKGTQGQESSTGAAQAAQGATSAQISKAASGQKQESKPASKAHAVPKAVSGANKAYSQTGGTGTAQAAQSATSAGIHTAIDDQAKKLEGQHTGIGR